MPPKNKKNVKVTNVIDELSQDMINEIIADPKQYGNSITVTKLEYILRKLSDSYNNNISIVEDDVFDTLLEVLEERDKKNKFLKEVGAPIKIEKDKIKLPYPMGSLKKIKPDKEILYSWLENYKGPFILSDKEDGISAQFYKKSDTEYAMYTRGDGLIGSDISNLIQYIIPKDVILNDIPIGTSIRGEIVMSKINFSTIKNVMKNARNAVAGLVNSKTIDYSFKKMIKLCDFVTYEVIYPRYKSSKQLKLLHEWNFHVVPYKVEKKLTYDDLTNYLKDRRNNSIYDIDGIVVVDDKDVNQHIEGYPDYAFAFKTVLSDQVCIATVKNVLWEASMDGYLKPKIEIIPIELGGTTITYATAFNAKFVEDNKLGPGAKVKLVRSGDVIPHIIEVIKSATITQMPNIPYKWTSTHVDIIVKDLFGAQSDVITTKRLTYFFKTIGVKYLSEGILTKLVNNGYKTVVDILSADKENLTEIDGIGHKMITKIYDNIDEAFKKVKLQQLMAATHIFGRGLGEKKIREILLIYPDIMNNKWSNVTFSDNIMKIDGFSTITTTKFCENFEEFKKMYKDISKYYDLTHLNYIKKKNKINKIQIDINELDIDELDHKDNINKDIINKSFVFTGFRDTELEEKINNLGGKITSKVSKNTTAVVTTDIENKSTKLIDANKLKIPIMSKNEFIDKFKL